MKSPLLGGTGQVVGIADAMYRIEHQDEWTAYLHELMFVARHIEQHFAEPIRMSDMADLVGLSFTHFNRQFRPLFRMTPMQYLRSVRVQAAQNLLTRTWRPLTEIAMTVGYTDQSYLTKRFREVTGITPVAYRKRFVPE